MRIYVKSPGKRAINIALPTRLLLNNITATIGTKQVNKYIRKNAQEEVGLSSLEEELISSAEVRKLISFIHKLKKRYPDWYLVEVDSADGEVVKIKL